MTPAQIAAREQLKSVTVSDVGRKLNTVAERFLAHWAGDCTAAKQSLSGMPLEHEFKDMLGLAVDTVVRRRQRQLDWELGGFQIRRCG